MTLHLIRHGKTAANEKRLYCGFTDIPLSKQGVDELAARKALAVYPDAQLYITSGLLRTNQTLRVLYGDPGFKVVAKLRELNFGGFEMLSHEALSERPDYQSWIADTDNNRPPNGESKSEFVGRVTAGFREVKDLCMEKAARSAVIVTHGGVIAVIMEYLFPQKRNFYEWQPACGEGYTVHLGNDGKMDFSSNIYQYHLR